MVSKLFHMRMDLNTNLQVVVPADGSLELSLFDVSIQIEAGASTRKVVEAWRRKVVRRLTVDEECVAVLGHRQWGRQHVRCDSLALLSGDALGLYVRHDPVEEVLEDRCGRIRRVSKEVV